MAMPLPEELMSSVLVFLRMKDMLEWRVVSSSTKAMWASESQVSRVARRVSVDLHLTLSKLKAISLLAPSPRLDGTEPVANRDVHSSKWRKALNIGHKGAAGHIEGNTMPSFIEAVRLGVDVIEFDVLTTQDGVKMGVDGLCSDYPERVHESNRRLRPQASQTDAATFPFPQGPGCSSGVDLRGLADEEEAAAASKGDCTNDDDDASTASMTSSLSSISSRSSGGRSGRSGSSSSGSSTTASKTDSTDATALGGWYSRCDTCEQSAEASDQQRLIAALYGDLAGVRDFAVGTVEDAKVLVKVCSHAVAVQSFLTGDSMKGKRATKELAAATALCKEAEIEAEQTLRPYVSSAETFKWSVNLISTAKGREFMSKLTRSLERDEVLPMLPFEKAFVKDLLGMRGDPHRYRSPGKTGKLDPSASLQAFSIPARLPGTTGSVASPRGANLVGRRLRRQRSSNGSRRSKTASTATAAATTSAPVAAVAIDSRGGSSSNGINHGNRNNTRGESIFHDGGGDTVEEPQGKDGTTVTNSTGKSPQDPSSCGNGNSEHERAPLGDVSAFTKPQNAGRGTASHSSSTVFVRSRQWGMRRLNRAGSCRGASAEDAVLSVHQLAISGGKRRRPLVLNESSEHSLIPGGRRGTSTERFHYGRDGAGGRSDGKTVITFEESRSRSQEMIICSAGVTGAGQHQGQGPAERENAVKTPPTVATAATPATLTAPSAFRRPENGSRCAPLSKWRIVPPPADRKPRADCRRWFHHRGRSPCWPASTTGIEMLPTATSSRDGMASAAEGGARAPQVAVRAENSVSAASAGSVATPERSVPQPLSVVAVWARAPAPRGADRIMESTPQVAGGECCAKPKPIGSPVSRSYEELQDPKPSAAAEGGGRTERAVRAAPRRRPPASAPAPGGTTTQRHRRRTRPRPASAGLLYFRAHLGGNAEEVSPALSERREADLVRHNGAAKSRSPSQGDQSDVLEPIPQAGGATPNVGNNADEIYRPGRVSEWLTATPPSGGTASRARGSGDVPLLSTSPTGEEGCACGPTDTAAATKTGSDRKSSVLTRPLPSDLLKPSRTKLGIGGRMDVNTLRVEGVGESIPSSGKKPRRRTQAGAERGATAAAITTEVTYPLLISRQSDPPAAGSCKINTATTTRAASLGTGEEVAHVRHRPHASTLEMISAVAHVLPSVPPQCVHGFEISIPAKKPRPASSSSPRRIRTTAVAAVAGIARRTTDGEEHRDEGAPWAPERTRSREAEGRGIRRLAAAPCGPLHKSFSWAGGDERNGEAGSGGGAASRVLSDEQWRQVGGGDAKRGPSYAEMVELHLSDTSGAIQPRTCMRTATFTCTGLDPSFPGCRRGGGGGGGEEGPPSTTPFSRWSLLEAVRVIGTLMRF
eukprot:g13981.t1